jgi:hypothetical protein
MVQRLITPLMVLVFVVAACGGGTASSSDLDIERRTGYSVIVESRPDGSSIGFAADRDAVSGEEFDVTEAVWRIDDGSWIEPPVTCLGKGQRVEIGVTQVESESRPGLLKERVVWVACLSPEDS